MDVFEIIEKTLYEHIRLRLLALGLTADVTLYTTPLEYEAELDALNTSLVGQGLGVVTVKGMTLSEYKYKKYGSYFSVEAGEITPGAIGSALTTHYTEQEDETFVKSQRPDGTVTYPVVVRIVSNKLPVYRLMRATLMELFGGSRYIPSLDPVSKLLEGHNIFLTYSGSVSVDSSDFKELVNTYRIGDVWPHPDTVLQTGIPKLDAIDYEGEAVNNLPS